jgi:hypothetical protein
VSSIATNLVRSNLPGERNIQHKSIGQTKKKLEGKSGEYLTNPHPPIRLVNWR